LSHDSSSSAALRVIEPADSEERKTNSDIGSSVVTNEHMQDLIGIRHILRPYGGRASGQRSYMSRSRVRGVRESERTGDLRVSRLSRRRFSSSPSHSFETSSDSEIENRLEMLQEVPLDYEESWLSK